MTVSAVIVNEYAIRQSLLNISASLSEINGEGLILELDNSKLDLSAFLNMENLLVSYGDLIKEFRSEFHGVLVSIDNTVALMTEMDQKIASIITSDGSDIVKSTI